MMSAFRNLGISKLDWNLLILKAEHPITGKVYYFVDKYLPFGASISCALFQKFSDAVAFLVTFRTKQHLINYLDDFLFAALLRSWCNQQIQIFIDICSEIKFPVSLEKTFWGTTRLVFLGLLLDTVEQLVMIPIEKIKHAVDLIDKILNTKRGKVTLKQLQKICGFLNFLGRAMVPGRAFIR